jgi:hypothetical protein
MKLQKTTLEKIAKINASIDNGATLEELKEEYFQSRPKRLEDYLAKYSEYINPIKKEDAQPEVEAIRHLTHHKPQERNPLEVLFKGEDELKAFRDLIENHRGIMELLESKKQQSGEDINVLEVPQELIKIKDLRVRSQRISEEIEKDFDEVIKKFPEYSKTTLINLALLEFTEKYS